MTKKWDIFDVLHELKYWRPPSYTTIMKLTGLKSKNAVFKHYKKLHEAGLIGRDYKPLKGDLKPHKSHMKIKMVDTNPHWGR